MPLAAQKLIEDELVGQLLLAADESDIERMDELLDALRLQADYVAAIIGFAENTQAPSEAESLREALAKAPSIAAFAELRDKIN